MKDRNSQRIAFFSKHKRRTLYSTFIMRALRRVGCDVRHINMAASRRILGERLAHRLILRKLRKWGPDAAIIFSGDIQTATLDALVGTTRTAIVLDDYFEVDAPVTEKIKKVDVFFHTMTGQLEEYRACGVKMPVYVHSGVDPELHRRGAFCPKMQSEVAFIGQAVYPHRLELIESLKREFDIKVYGKGWERQGLRPIHREVEVADFARVCASARVMVGIDKTADKELYFSNRTWFTLGCGGFLVTRYIPGLERIFANRRHLVWFHDAREAAELIRYYLEHEGERKRIADCGFEFVHRHYPFDRMARNILGVLFHERTPDPFTDPGI